MDKEIARIVNKYTFHRNFCTVNNAPGNLGNCCSCDIRGRKIHLYDEIQKLLNIRKES